MRENTVFSKKRCGDCHFYSNFKPPRGVGVITFDDREVVFECKKHFWTNRDPETDVDAELKKSRTSCEYFVKKYEGMNDSDARDLLDRQSTSRRDKRERRTLWIAVIALVVSIIFGGWSVLKSCIDKVNTSAASETSH